MTKIEIYEPPEYTRGTIGEYMDALEAAVRDGKNPAGTIAELAWAERVVNLKSQLAEAHTEIRDLKSYVVKLRGSCEPEQYRGIDEVTGKLAIAEAQLAEAERERESAVEQLDELREALYPVSDGDESRVDTITRIVAERDAAIERAEKAEADLNKAGDAMADWIELHHAARQEVARLREALKAAEADNARLRKALRRYGQHDGCCSAILADMALRPAADCDCGYRAAYKEQSEVEAGVGENGRLAPGAKDAPDSAPATHDQPAEILRDIDAEIEEGCLEEGEDDD